VGTHGTLVAARVQVFADLAPGELGLLVDSYGHLALVLNNSSAADYLKTQEGEVLTLRAPA
jgi:S-adenosylmethionine hydrolase